MGENEPLGEPILGVYIFVGFITLMCIFGFGCCYCAKKCQEQHERAEHARKEELWAKAPVVQPSIAYQNQRKLKIHRYPLKIFNLKILFQKQLYSTHHRSK